MREKRSKKSISTLSSLVLLGVFAACILSVLLGGASAYERMTHRSHLAYDSRTAVQYVAGKVRQASAPDAVSLAAFRENAALCIRERFGDETYLTRIYCFDGWLMELFSLESGEFAPEDGEKILPLEELSLSLENALLRVEFSDGGSMKETLLLALRGAEVAP